MFFSSVPFRSVPFRENTERILFFVPLPFQNCSRTVEFYSTPSKEKKQEQTRTLLCLMFSVSPNRDHESYFIELQLKVIFRVILIPLIFSLKLVKFFFQLLACPIKTLMVVVHIIIFFLSLRTLSPTTGANLPCLHQKKKKVRDVYVTPNE